MDTQFEDDGMPLSRVENEKLLAEAEKAPKGVIIHPEDINVGDDLAIYHIKKDPTEMAPILGQSFNVKAIQLPYLIGTMYADPDKGSMTFDCRFVNFMRVSKEYAEAQTDTSKKRGPQR